MATGWEQILTTVSWFPEQVSNKCVVDDRDADVEERDAGVGVDGSEFDGGVKCIDVVEKLVKGFFATSL